MNEPPLSAAQVSARFVDCAACLGYLQDTGRYAVHEQVAPELHYAFAMLLQADPEAFAHVCKLSRSHTSTWVRYYLAVAVGKHAPALAIPLLEELRTAEGLVGAGVQSALHQFKRAQ
jgi:hypothetical protein